MSFKNARWKAGKKAQETADFMNVSRTTVSYWENGVFLPTTDKLPALAAFYNCTVDELLRDNPQNHSRIKAVEGGDRA